MTSLTRLLSLLLRILFKSIVLLRCFQGRVNVPSSRFCPADIVFSILVAARHFSRALSSRLLHSNACQHRGRAARAAAIHFVPKTRLRRRRHQRVGQTRLDHCVREPPEAAAESHREARIQTKVSRRIRCAAVRSVARYFAAPFHDASYPDVTIVGARHGTDSSILPSIISTSFANLATTDSGFFGSMARFHYLLILHPDKRRRERNLHQP